MTISFCWSVCHSFSPVTVLQLDFGLAAEVGLPLVSVSSAWYELFVGMLDCE